MRDVLFGSLGLLLAAASDETPTVGIGAMLALVLFIIGSGYIGVLANRAMRSSKFAEGFFLGNRGLGSWALALTATVQSGGTFMGFPSLVYTYGWVVSLWIASYIVVPISGFGVIGKRVAQLSRKTNALTVPDLFRDRFDSPMLGLASSLCIMLFMSAMLVAQFKAGATVMKLAWPGSGQLALSEDAPEKAQYLVTELALKQFAEAKVPADVVSKLRPLSGKGFASEVKLLTAAKDLIGTDDTKIYASVLINTCKQFDYLYLTGLIIFTLTVVGYTLLGGFLAAVWTDLFQSVMMVVGVLLLLILTLVHMGSSPSVAPALAKTSGVGAVLEASSRTAVASTDQGYLLLPGYDDPAVKGYDKESPREFLPITLAISFFFVWVFAGFGSPASTVRIMAVRDTDTLRRSIYLLAVYNLFIYLPLIFICICGRAEIPTLGTKSDEIIPRMAILTTQNLPLGSFVAGLILAAPFGAVMATVSAYLVVISSGLVRDIYQRLLNPNASETEIRRLSYFCMILVGGGAVALNINPVPFLQSLVVFSGSGAAATFCVPTIMLCYWKRANVPGMFASMLAGAGTQLVLYIAGSYPAWFGVGSQRIGPLTGFKPYYLLGFEPLVWAIAGSLVLGVVVTLLTPPPDSRLVRKFFAKDELA